MEMSGYLHVALATGKEQPVPHRAEGWVGPTAGVEMVAKTKLPLSTD
jgi:hypothetical protein